jgi:hypothetical protein
LDIEPIAAGHGCRVGAAGPLLVMVFDSEPHLEMLDVLDKAQAEHIARHTKMAGLTVIAMDRLESPGPEFRTRSKALSDKHFGAIENSAMVILTRGLAAVMVRTFLAGYQLLVHYDHPQKTFRELAPAIEWLQGLEGQLPAVKGFTGLAAAVEAFVAKKTP